MDLYNKSMLHTEPSFCIYSVDDECGDEGKNRHGHQIEALERTVTIGEGIEGGEFSFEKTSMGLIQEEGEELDGGLGGLNGIQTLSVEGEVGLVSHGGAVDFTLPDLDCSGDFEEYYKRMVDEFPSHPLFLRNYGQLLQSKGDLHGAEDYLFRATLADPEDSEILLLYAKLTWELHHDQCRALSYFERAAQAAPEDSHTLAAYARFLWEIDSDEEDGTQHNNSQTKEACCVNEPGNLTSKEQDEQAYGGADLSLPNIDGSGDVEDYYKRMVGEFPNNPLFLRNYAHILQSKGELHEAEDYYFRATVADPEDGETLVQYAKLTWELHHDQYKASSYFERAALAAPEDSHILAAYARFLWEIDDDEDDGPEQDHIQATDLYRENELDNLTSKDEKECVDASLHLTSRLELDGAGVTDTDSVEEYNRKKVEENSCHPLFLRNYAQFLQSKGDLDGAEDYYSRAILADPEDGEIISQYAQLVWEHHHNRGKSLIYFERAVQATPGDSNVLAAYARFLWEAGVDEEEDSVPKDHICALTLH